MIKISLGITELHPYDDSPIGGITKGSLLKICGVVELPFKFVKTVVKLPFVVIKDFRYPCLIGTDSVSYKDFQLDFKNMIAYHEGAPFKFSTARGGITALHEILAAEPVLPDVPLILDKDRTIPA